MPSRRRFAYTFVIPPFVVAAAAAALVTGCRRSPTAPAPAPPPQANATSTSAPAPSPTLPQTAGDALKAIAAIKTWPDLLNLAALLRHPDFHVGDALAIAAFRLYRDTGKVPASDFSDDARRDFAEAMFTLAPQVSVENRAVAVALAGALGFRPPRSIPPGIAAADEARIVLHDLTDDQPFVRRAAERRAAYLFRPGQADPQVVAGIVDALRWLDADARLAVAGLEQLGRMGPKARAIAGDIALARLAAGRHPARVLLALASGDAAARRAAAQAIADDRALSASNRAELAELLESLATDPSRADRRAAVLLTQGDGALYRHADQLIDANPGRFDRLAIARLIVTGEVGAMPVAAAADVPNEVALQARAARMLPVPVPAPAPIDPAAARRLTLLALDDEDATSRLAALNAIRELAVPIADVRDKLIPLLDDPDDAVRFAAARLLDRQDILKRARVPELVADLRSDDVSRRVVAARQLDELAVESRELTSALIRATDRGDFAARLGLVAAVERAHQSRRPAAELLREAAGAAEASAERAYARAAVRELDATKTKEAP